MEKELKSCTGVLLRADLTGYGQFSQSADFCKKGGMARRCPVKSALKRMSVKDLNYFSIIMFYYIFSTTYQKVGDFSSLLNFWTFAQCKGG